MNNGMNGQSMSELIKQRAPKAVAYILERGNDPSAPLHLIAQEVNRKAKDEPDSSGWAYPSFKQPNWTQSSVSQVLREAGKKRRRAFTKPGARKHNKPEQLELGAPLAQPATVIAAGGTVTKWDVLKAIENCEDLSTNARKALLDLVWRELFK